MPSYRATVAVRDMRPGHRPPEVLDAASGAVAAPAAVEARSIDINAGTPVVVVRFAVDPGSRADEDAAARGVAAQIRAGVDRVAQAGGCVVQRRVGGRWERA